MPILSDPELRILVKFAVKQLPPSLLNDLRGPNRDRALDSATSIILEHFAKGKHEVHRPEIDESMSFNSMKKG